MATQNLLHQSKDGLLLSDDETLLELPKIFQWLSVESYWARGREFDVLEKSFKHSYPIGVYEGSSQIAVARIVSDTATFAWLCDVFVDSAFRGRGVGTWLAEASTEWAEKNGIKRIILATRDAHEVYSRAGFEPLKNSRRWMEIDQRPQRDGN
jgi:GNAT superfamily N-acetyltransferase